MQVHTTRGRLGWNSLCNWVAPNRRQTVSGTEETPEMRRKLLPLILGGALSVAAVAPAAAAPPTAIAGAAGLVNVIVQAVIDQVNVAVLNDALNNSFNDVVEVNIDDSLNNALQNAFQNARILNGLTVTIENVLNDLNVNVEDVTVTVIDGGVSINILGAGGVIDN